MFKIKIIGGDSAFSRDNSSFLITHKHELITTNLLFDCPVNSFHYIKENNIDIDKVWISHTHFDHISGLEQLVYYNYFVKNKITYVYSHGKVLEELKNIFANFNIIFDNGSVVENTMVEFHDINELKKAFINISLKPLKGNHVVKENYGLIFEINNKSKIVIITGDTKASQVIHDKINKYLDCCLDRKIYVFHDYSYIDEPFKNVHCCETDFKYYYKDLLKYKNIKWFKYHNEKFNKEYKGKTIKI